MLAVGRHVGGDRGDERRERAPNVLEEPRDGGAVVDEQGNLHRIVRRRHAKNFALRFIFAHDEIRWSEAADVVVRRVDNRHVQGALERLRQHGAGNREPRERRDERNA